MKSTHNRSNCFQATAKPCGTDFQVGPRFPKESGSPSCGSSLPHSTDSRATLVLVTILAVALAAVGCGEPNSPRRDKVVLKVGQVLPADHPTSRAMDYFKERLEELSDDRIDVRLFLSGQIGSANELIMECRLGNVEAAVVSTAPLAQHVEILNVLVMPFVFRDNTHQYAVVDGPIGRELDRHLADRGIIAAAYFDSGSRNIMTKAGPIETPDQLKGLKIRVMSSNVLRAAVDRLGASAQPMSQAEVYSALQTGVIDGWENNPATCLVFSMYETGCTHFAWTRHVAIPDALILSRECYDALDEDLKRAVDQAAADTRQKQRELWQEYEGQAIEKLEQAGMVFNEVEHEAFAEKFEGFYDRYAERYGPEFGSLVEQIRDVGDEEQ